MDQFSDFTSFNEYMDALKGWIRDRINNTTSKSAQTTNTANSKDSNPATGSALSIAAAIALLGLASMVTLKKRR